eukprot:1148805-Pelagomonas_calceolata.AAC.4
MAENYALAPCDLPAHDLHFICNIYRTSGTLSHKRHLACTSKLDCSYFAGTFLKASCANMQNAVCQVNKTFCIIEVGRAQRFQEVSPKLDLAISQRRMDDLRRKGRAFTQTNFLCITLGL